jgi:hypothetical protein
MDNLVVVNGWVYIPTGSPSTHTTLLNAHDVGHEGIAKTLHRLRADFHLPGACTTVQDFVRTCLVC